MGFHAQSEGFLLAIGQVPSYIPSGARSFWKLIELLAASYRVVADLGRTAMAY
jgi:hypothetical protein